MERLIGPRKPGRLCLALGLGAALLTSAAGWAKPPVEGEEATEAFGIAGPGVEKTMKPVRPTPSEKLGIGLAAVPEVRLEAVDAGALLQKDQLGRQSGMTKVLRFGIGRDVALSVQDGHWYDLADGKRLWVAEVATTDALGVRLHFKDVRLPAGAELAVYAPTGSDPLRGVVKSGSPRFDPDRSVEFFDAAGPIAKRGELWTGTFSGDRVRIEYLAPAAAADGLPFTVDRLQHIYLDPVASLAKGLAEKAAGSCNNDVSCFPQWIDLSRAVSGIGFIGSDSLFCTGQLLNTSGPADFSPYWLTANHCLSSQFDASDAEFFWLYQTASCGGGVPSLTSVPRSRGATLLSTNPQSDYTLLMVEGAVPRDLTWAGWTSKEPPTGLNVVAIHHPSGDFKRISFGFKDVVTECNFIPGFGGRKLVRTSWTDAPTEPGSSGSGIFRADTGQLFGQLLGGPSSCNNENFDCYGSFASTFTKVKNLLKAGSDDKLEQNDACNKARAVKAGLQSNRIVKVNDEDWFKTTVKPGQTVNIDLGFANANGDVDLEFYGACNQGALFASDGTSDGESLALTNVGSRPATAIWRVFLSNDTRNNYDMAVSFQ